MRLFGARERGIDVIQRVNRVVTYVLFHGVQDEGFQLVKAVVDSCSPPLLHDRLIALQNNNSLLGVTTPFTYNDGYIRHQNILLFNCHIKPIFEHLIFRT
jgi:hypothetical protein